MREHAGDEVPCHIGEPVGMKTDMGSLLQAILAFQSFGPIFTPAARQSSSERKPASRTISFFSRL